jgi:hypothetical protein
MSDRFEIDAFDDDQPRPALSRQSPPLPPWIARRVLGSGERVTWVWGPHYSPEWERVATHPALILPALAVGGLCLAAGWALGGTWGNIPFVSVLAAIAVVVGAVFVLAFANAYFTRLVVTDARLVILQGYEVCRSWGMDELPPSLVHYGMAGAGAHGRSVDLDAVKNLLGGSSDQFVQAKTILAFGKQLDAIKTRDPDRDRP